MTEARLLAVDVGNTNTVLGLYEDDTLLRHWRLTTRRDATADEIVLSVRGLLDASPGRERAGTSSSRASCRR